MHRLLAGTPASFPAALQERERTTLAPFSWPLLLTEWLNSLPLPACSRAS